MCSLLLRIVSAGWRD
ncbi:hypothetical protein Q0S95_19540 [Escherichia coli O8:H7]|nr:hypothetical protein [Escherichia coli]